MKAKKIDPVKAGKKPDPPAGPQKPPKSFPRVAFLVCPRRKNKPKIQPVVCEKRCRDKAVCPAYYAYVQPALFKGSEISPRRRKSAPGAKPSGKRP